MGQQLWWLASVDACIPVAVAASWRRMPAVSKAQRQGRSLPCLCWPLTRPPAPRPPLARPPQLYARRRFFYPPSCKDSYFALVVDSVRAETQVGGSGVGRFRLEEGVVAAEAAGVRRSPVEVSLPPAFALPAQPLVVAKGTPAGYAPTRCLPAAALTPCAAPCVCCSTRRSGCASSSRTAAG